MLLSDHIMLMRILYPHSDDLPSRDFPEMKLGDKPPWLQIIYGPSRLIKGSGEGCQTKTGHSWRAENSEPGPSVVVKKRPSSCGKEGRIPRGILGQDASRTPKDIAATLLSAIWRSLITSRGQSLQQSTLGSYGIYQVQVTPDEHGTPSISKRICQYICIIQGLTYPLDGSYQKL